MQAPTHATFGLVFVIGAGTVLGVVLTPAVAAFAVLGALLPDVDTPTSLIGKLCLPLARLLERRFGHRTVTHSLLGLALFTGPVVPLGLVNPQWPLAFGLGYLSHLLIDCANKSGTPLFYPSPIRAVLPRSEALRIAVGLRGRDRARRRPGRTPRRPGAAPPDGVRPRPPRAHAHDQRRDHRLPGLGGPVRGLGRRRRPLPALPAAGPPALPGPRDRQREHADRAGPRHRHDPHRRPDRGREHLPLGDPGAPGRGRDGPDSSGDP